MAKGDIEINEAWCKGCGLCAHFCAQKCITMPGNRLGPLGYFLPEFSDPDKCNACGICSWLCPDLAITVYKYIDSPA